MNAIEFVLSVVCAASPSGLTEEFPAEMRERVLAACVRVKTERVWGSGTIVGYREGRYYVVFASHCVGDRHTIDFFSGDAKQTEPIGTTVLDVELLADLPEFDVALLRFPCDSKLPIVPICAPHEFRREAPQRVVTVGCSHQERPSIREGRVFWFTSHQELKGKFAVVSTGAAPGRSGGALIDERELLIGTCYGGESQGVYTDLPAIWALCREAKAHFLYLDGDFVPPPSPPPVKELVVTLFKLVIATIVVALARR